MLGDPARSIAGAYLFAVALLLADAASKAAVVAGFPLGGYYPVNSILNLGHWRNPGAAFSFLHDAGGWQRGFFIALGLLASVALAVWIAKRSTAPRERWAYAAILGGALGNVLDRVIRGAVVDWLDFHWSGNHWPAFNIADIGISIGAALLIAQTIGSTQRFRGT